MSQKFVATRNKGFAMTFDNLFTISVQYGTGNYCEKKNLGADGGEEMKTPRWESRTAEIAVYKDEKFIDIGDDTVIGWLTPNEVAKVIEIVSGYQGQTMTGMTGERYIQTEIKKLGL